MSAAKRAQREAGIRARGALTDAVRAAHSAAVCAHITGSPVFQRAKTVLSYRAVRGEIDLSLLDMSGKTVAYPHCEDAGVMRALVPAGGLWSRGAFGIMEPDPAQSVELHPEDIDLVLVPCSAFDTAGGRVGMGGGYYDRFLPACTKAVRMLAAHEAQRVEAADTDIHDARMDFAVTEKGLYRC